MSGGGHHKAEIVIIRRNHGGHDDGHHGGAWKIAYADFVTAMMAFFLVMWLINASNEATRAQVASYFNPIKLTDSSTAKRGLEDPKETFKQKHSQAESPLSKASEVPAELRAAEDKMMQEPQQTLDQIVGEPPPAPAVEAPPAAPATVVAQAPGPAARDPFDPQSWHGAARPDATPPPEPATGPRPGEAGEPAPAAAPQTSPPATAESGAKPPEAKTEAPKPEAAAAAEKAPEPAVKVETPAKPETPPAAAPSAPPDAASDTQAAAALAIKADILSRYGAGDKALPANLEVKATHEGLLISLTDRHAFSMFAVGSAEPQQKLVELAAAIGEALKNRPGQVVIRGHTDARPYRNKKFDNWQLSTARAHMAFYMLVRGGLPEDRVLRVEGYADRDPINPADPQADENRRIDVLLVSPPP